MCAGRCIVAIVPSLSPYSNCTYSVHSLSTFWKNPHCFDSHAVGGESLRCGVCDPLNGIYIFFFFFVCDLESASKCGARYVSFCSDLALFAPSPCFLHSVHRRPPYPPMFCWESRSICTLWSYLLLTFRCFANPSMFHCSRRMDWWSTGRRGRVYIGIFVHGPKLRLHRGSSLRPT